MLRIRDMFQKGYTKRLMRHLIIINMFMIALDITLLVLEFVTPMGIWGSFKGFSYSIKLKLEFHILNKLKESPRPKITDCSESENLHSSELDNIRKAQWNGAVHKSNAYAGSSATVPEGGAEQIFHTREFTVGYEQCLEEQGAVGPSVGGKGSPTSSTVEFASKGT